MVDPCLTCGPWQALKPKSWCRPIGFAGCSSWRSATARSNETLGELIRIVESTSRTGVLGSILLLDHDGKHLRHGAAPSLPDAYCAAIDGAEIGPCAGSCGTAAYTARPVFVSDIANDPLWADS